MEKCIIHVPLILLALIALAGAPHASTNFTDYGDLIGSLTSAITALPGHIVDSFFSYTVNGLISTSQQLVDSSFKFMFSSPDPMWFCNSYVKSPFRHFFHHDIHGAAARHRRSNSDNIFVFFRQ